MLEHQTVEKQQPPRSLPSDEEKRPDGQVVERVAHGFVAALLADPEDPMICRGLD